MVLVHEKRATAYATVAQFPNRKGNREIEPVESNFTRRAGVFVRIGRLFLIVGVAFQTSALVLSVAPMIGGGHG